MINLNLPFQHLLTFRLQIHASFTFRADALFELIKAVLFSPVHSAVEASLSPAFRRRFASVYDALRQGRIDRAELRKALAAAEPDEAIMEGVAYELRYLFEVLAAAGVQPQEIRLQGGASKSPTWSQIKADVWGRRVTMLEFTDGACLGDAILAGLGIGVFQDYREGVERLVHVKRALNPDPAAHAVYNKLYAIYRDVATTLDPYFARLQEVTLTERLKETPWEEKVHLLDFV
jgi:sugar (pentulose or hexulose) kinase